MSVVILAGLCSALSMVIAALEMGFAYQTPDGSRYLRMASAALCSMVAALICLSTLIGTA